MAGSYSATGTYSNLTRLELEQLRKSDFFAGGKALTVGDSGLSPEGVVGVGSINAEPYSTAPTIDLGDIYSIRPPVYPGTGLLTITQIARDNVPSETVQWYGPSTVVNVTTEDGAVTSPGGITWGTSVDMVAAGVQVGDYLIIRNRPSGSGANEYKVASITSVAANSLGVNNASSALTMDALGYPYTIIRPNVVQLFAVPGSGPLGREQSFMMVVPGSTLHTQAGPTLNAINADRVRNLVPPLFGADSSVDRADAVFGPPNTSGPRLALDHLGYRVVLYKSNASGTAPDLTSPIATLNPVIDSTIPAADQRMTIDYKAGIVRFSVAPRAGDDIKPSGGNGGVSTTTGRLQLYAVFFAVDQSLTARSADSLFVPNSTEFSTLTPAKVHYNGTGWVLGATTDGNDFMVRANTGSTNTDFGGQINLESPDSFRGIRIGRTLVYSGNAAPDNGTTNFNEGTLNYKNLGVRRGDLVVSNGLTWLVVDISSDGTTVYLDDFVDGWDPSGNYSIYRGTNAVQMVSFGDNRFGNEFSKAPIQEKTSITVSTSNNPRELAADFNYLSVQGSVSTETWVDSYAHLNDALLAASFTGNGVVHLKRGEFRFIANSPVYVPPGVTVEGEGAATKVKGTTSGAFKFGANTPWGVYDPTWNGTTTIPNTWQYANGTNTSNTVEGYEVVWNPIRRVWAIFVADETADIVYFNELRPDGSMVYSDNAYKGIDLKAMTGTSFPLFTRASVGLQSAHHTTGHYPRAAFDENHGGYVVVWVEDATPGAGYPVTRYVSLGYNTQTAQYSVRFTDTVSNTGNGMTTTPSVAVNGNYAVIATVNFAGGVVSPNLYVYTLNLSFGSVSLALQRTTNSPNNASPSIVRSLIGSTDVAWSGVNDEFVVAYSVRRHKIVTGSGATIASGVLTDPAVTNWTGDTLGLSVRIGSRFLDLTNGKNGVVIDSSAANLTVVYDDGTVPPNGSYTYAIAPLCWVMACTVNGGTGASTTSKVVAGHANTTNFRPDASVYYDQEREPDFVRLSKGPNGKVLAVYQNFDTTAAHRNSNVENWDNGFNIAYLDFPHGSMNPWPYREHLGTSFNILDIYYTPNTGTVVLTPQDRDTLERSMGSRDPMVPYRNVQSNTWRPYNEVAPLLYFMECSSVYNEYPSLIPDITWNGQDWVVVSPTPCSYHSYSGAYFFFSGSHYLIDPNMLFGQDGVGSVSATTRAFLPITVDSGTRIYFPNNGNTVSISSVFSEHVVRLSAAPTGAISGSVIEYQVADGAFSGGASTTKGFKTPGFRVSVDGEMIVSTAYTTHALNSDSSGSTIYDRKQEVLNRNMFGSVVTDAISGLTTNQWNDLVEGYRLSANLSFQGICVGAPKRGTSVQTPSEAPYMAIAWGDNFYCAVDLEKWGLSGSFNKQLRAFRQTFGPWKSGLKSLTLESGASVTNFAEKTRKHVLTRHGGIGASSNFFDTDGFRNAFIHWGVQSFYINHGPNPYAGSGGDPLYSQVDSPDPRFVDSWFTSVCAVFTDAEGRNPIRKRLRVQNGLMPRGSRFQNGGAGVGFSDYSHPAHTGRVVWTGSQFLGVIAAENRLYFFDLGVDDRTEGEELTGVRAKTYNFNQYQNDWINLVGYADLDFGIGGPTVVKPDGSQVVLNNPQVQDALTFEVCWSGEKLAVAWRVGGVPRVNANLNSGCTLGITILNSTRPIGLVSSSYLNEPLNVNVSTYVLSHLTTAYQISSPRILWDGTQFVVASKYGPYLSMYRIPKDGFRSNVNIANAAAFNSSGINGGGNLGTISSDGKLTASGNLLAKRGDLVQIVRTAPPSGTVFGDPQFSNMNGVYKVVAVNGATNQIQLSADLSADSTSIGYTVYGMILAGEGALPVLDTSLAFFNPSGTLKQQSVLVRPAGSLDTTISAISDDNILGFFYLESRGDFVIFTANSADLGTIAHAHVVTPNWTLRKTVTFDFSSEATPYNIASISFNGSHFAMVRMSKVNNISGSYAALVNFIDLNLSVVHEVTLSNPIGSGNSSSFYGSKPGVGYGSINSASTSQYVARAAHAKWNPVSAQWTISVAFQVADELSTLLSTEAESISQTLVDLDSLSSWTTAGSAGRVLSFSALTTPIQTGVRYLTYLENNRITSAGSLPTNNTDSTPPSGNRSYMLTSSDSRWPSGYLDGMVISALTTVGELYSSVQRDDIVKIDYVGSVGSTTGYYRASSGSSVVTAPATQHCFLKGSISPVPTGNTTVSIKHGTYTNEFIFHVVDGDVSAPKAITISTDQSEVSVAVPTSHRFHAVPREDVFVWTIGHNAHPVLVDSADQVFVEDVDFEGFSDISLRMRHMSRPYWQISGAIVGMPNETVGNTILPAPKANHIHPTPAGKVNLLRITNVRSGVPGRYGQKPLKGENK